MKATLLKMAAKANEEQVEEPNKPIQKMIKSGSQVLGKNRTR
jgi:hypothetical protein